MDSLTTTEIVFIAAGAVSLVGYVAFILVPAWTSYGRFWEKLGASFLTLFILLTLAGAGAVLGLAIVYFYDQYA